MNSPHAQSPPPFGRQLRFWRRRRGLSQLNLASAASLSQRYLSFIETGRSRPGEGVVLRIAEALDLPLRERNALLQSAGLASRYPELPLSHESVVPFRNAIAQMLKAHEPYPAYVIDRWWNVVDVNDAGGKLFPLPAQGSLNSVDAFLAPGPVRDMIENFDIVAWTFVQRLRHEVAQSGPDPELQALLERAEGYLVDVPPPEDDGGPAGDLLICPRLRIAGELVSTVSMVARFGNTREVSLDELRVELVYPADDAADAFFRGLRPPSGE